MEELSLSPELRTNISLLTNQLLDPQALLRTLSCKSAALSQLEFERDQFLSQHKASLQVLPTHLTRISTEIHTAKAQLTEETERNGKLQESAAGLTTSPLTATKELKRLRKLRAAKETAIVRLRGDLQACAQRKNGVRLIIEPEGELGKGLETEIASVQESNRALRHQIARIERKIVAMGHKIDWLRRRRGTQQPAKPQEMPMTPLSQRDTIAPSSPPLPMEIRTNPTPEPLLESVPSDVVALFRMPQSRKQQRMDKYVPARDPKDPFYLPILVFSTSPQFLEFKKDLQMAIMLYKSDTECPKEHVDIVVNSYGRVEEKEAAVALLVTALSGVSNAFSASDARFLLVSVMSISPDPSLLWTLAKYAVSDFYRNRKWEGTKQQWSSDAGGVSTLQQLWLTTAASLLTRIGHTSLLRKLAKLLCAHHNTPMLQTLHSLTASISSLGYVKVLIEAGSGTDEELCGVIITSKWGLRDRVWTLKRVTELRGVDFLHMFLTRHMAPIFTDTQPGAEARLFYFRAIGVALACMKGEPAWSSMHAHLVQVLKAISPCLHWQGQSVFTAEEVATATEMLAKA
jgi:hypothetical protein